ncbi:unnamed protein product [Rotaria socialis]|uniref:Peroxiredoxin-5 n=1 Tax=Rotaria socialis TaxID=392032 RepID=A0A817N7L1_9BILA|nr:unnamed protein product [Rotaria socialis]CAF3203136.1 unnamed protein product [Rotaria socialis]CAF3360385.1 unnamed protein product [Rotaria socialis]CAF3591146.1 unnamed protein product [Rotaria socialis]CAF3721783.1 unnamed protein product [Rotaria socialis]
MFRAIKTIQLSATTAVRSFHATKPLFLASNSAIKEGATLPKHTLFENEPKNKVNIEDVFAGKKGILFGVPGAFTPGCSKTHLPGYVNSAKEFQKLGYDTIVCVTVNDPFVCQAWAKEHKAEGKVRVLADPDAKFTKALGLEKDLSAVLGNVRSSRYAMVIDNNKVQKLFIEPDGTGLSCSVSQTVLDEIKKGDLAK